jgi:phosphohistidine swiveling domain-containing protein
MNVGGKAASLARLQRLGQRVPPFYVVTNDWTLAQIRDAHAKTIPADAFVAVRSSAADEDAAGASFAGMHETYLFIRGEEALLDAIARVRESAHSERALAYRREQGLDTEHIEIAVIVQQMIDARVSGVVFTANPTTQDVHELVISSLFGLGEGLVSEGFDADTFRVRKHDLSIVAELAEKSEAIVFDRQRGFGTIKTTSFDPHSRSLTDDEVRTLARAALVIERAYGRPQDIEFAFDAQGLAILQSRPITTIAQNGPAAGNRRLWDNSNIIESFSGVTSPMTFSVIRRAYAIVYRCFAQVMGIPDEVVHENRHVFDNMLGLVQGHVYYNLLNWYAAVRLFPGYEHNRVFMESMMGVKESASDEAPGSGSRSPLVWLLARTLFNFMRIRSLADGFQRNFKRHYDEWSHIDLDTLQPHELMRLYDDFESKVLWNWRAPIINDFFVMIFYGTLKKLCTSWCGDVSGSLQNGLLSGEGGIESTEPARELLRLAAMVKRDPELLATVAEGDPREAWERCRTGNPARPDRKDCLSSTAFSEALDRYLDLYGFRCMNELKLEEPSLRDRPELLITFIRNYLGAGDDVLDLAKQEARERQMRAEAEASAFAKIGSPIKRVVFRFVLRRARLGVKNRENMRFARTRIFGLVREVVRAFGRRLHDEGLLDSADDVFYLGLEELWDFVKGTSLGTDLRGLAALRRAEFERYRAADPPDERFETFGMVYHRNVFNAPHVAATASDDGALHGIACSPGVVTREVKLVRSPTDDMQLRGEILVTERTDPGWVPLYPSISGLLIERGSILSHSAIVAREMGIPTIVGIRGLTSLVKSGDRVTMDGGAGTVVIERQDGTMPIV